MADLIRTAQYFKVQIADKPGTLVDMLTPLHETGVNLLAVHAFPRRRKQRGRDSLSDGSTRPVSV